MNAKEVLHDLRSAGYTLCVAAGKIRINGDEGQGLAVTDEVRERIRAVRDELLQVLEAEEAKRVELVPAADFAAELRGCRMTDTEGNVIAPPALGPEWHPHLPLPEPDEVIPVEYLEAVGWHPFKAARIADALAIALTLPAGIRIGIATIIEPGRWRQLLCRDALRGPRGERARHGVLWDEIVAILSLPDARGSPSE